MRAVIYARYSSDNQRDASIEDQLEVCRRYAKAHGWQVTCTYEDRALSGGSAFRPAFQAHRTARRKPEPRHHHACWPDGHDGTALLVGPA